MAKKIYRLDDEVVAEMARSLQRALRGLFDTTSFHYEFVQLVDSDLN